MMPNVGDEKFVNCGHHWTTDNGQFHGDMQFVCQSSVVTDTSVATITVGRNHTTVLFVDRSSTDSLT